MNDNDLKGQSKTNWESLDRKTDADIDFSDIPPLEEEFWEKAHWEMPAQPVVALTVDSDVLEWFKAQGGDYRRRLNAALRIYAEAHQK